MATTAEAHVLSRSPLLRTVFGKRLFDLRRSFPWWALALAATSLMYAGFYPSVRENAAAFDSYLDRMPEFMRSLIGETGFASATGYLRSELFSFLGPILMLVFAIGVGGRVTAEEDASTLDLLLSTPVRRRRVIGDTFLALIVSTAVLAAVLWGAVASFGPPFELHVDLWNLAAACASLWLLAVTFGTLTMAIGAGTGSRGLAIGAAAGVALATFIVNVLGPMVDAVEPFQKLSPFYYYIGVDPLIEGLSIAHAGVLAGVSAALFLVATVLFERRDLAS